MRRSKRLVSRLYETLEIPPEVFVEVPRIEMVGRIQCRLENHRGIERYRPEEVVFRLAEGAVAIRGRNLIIGWVDRHEAVVTGEIFAVGFVTRAGRAGRA